MTKNEVKRTPLEPSAVKEQTLSKRAPITPPAANQRELLREAQPSADTTLPTIGRIVLVTPAEGGEAMAAIVTKAPTTSTSIDVTAFPPAGSPPRAMMAVVHRSEAGDQLRCWEWPPRG